MPPTDQPIRSSRLATPAALALLTGLAGILITGMLTQDFRQIEVAKHAQQNERMADGVAAAVTRETELALALQSAVAAKLTTASSIGAAGFQEFIDGLRLFEILPSARAIAYAPLVQSYAVPDLAIALATDSSRERLGYPAFRVWPEGQRPTYAPLILVSPVQGNDRVFGFDVLSNAERKAAVEAAIRDRRPKASAPLVLTQDQDTRAPGILVVAPVGSPEAVIGIVAMGVTIDRLLKSLSFGERDRVEIFDVGPSNLTSPPALVFQDGAATDQPPHIRHVDVAGRRWQIAVTPREEADWTNSLLVLMLGIALSAFGAFAVWRTKSMRQDLENLVNARTQDLKAASDALQRANAELQRKARDLERANATKAEFLGRLGHELRTPLNAIIGFSDLMRMGIAGQLNSKQTGYVEDVLGAGSHLLALVNRLLDLVKLERNEVTIDRAPFEPLKEVAAVIPMLQPIASARAIGIVFEENRLAGSSDLMIQGDALAFRQITANLLENAIKFSPEGSMVRVALLKLDGSILLEVDDTGVGIPADQIAQIFEPFHQVEIGDARRFGGAGLGLAIVRGLAERMGGSIMVSSELGRGSRFRVRFPSLDSQPESKVA